MTDLQRHKLLIAMAQSVGHTQSAARRHDHATRHHHKGYRHGIIDTLTILGVDATTIHDLRMEAKKLADGRSLPPPPED